MSAGKPYQDWLSGLDESAARELDVLCDRFEAAWKTGAAPPIEDWLVGLASNHRRAFTLELIALERQLREKAGQQPTAEDYRPRFPELRDDIDGMFLERTVVAKNHRELLVSLPQPGQRIGDFQIIERLKSGGMGVIYKARQISVNRLVALKVIRSGDGANPNEIERFTNEAEAAAKLEHPGIVPVFGSGSEDGQHYIAMAFIDGPSLAERIAQGPLSAREPAELVRRVALAVDYAHRQGVIHRDLKPGNILLAPVDHARDHDAGIWEDSQTSPTSGKTTALPYEPKVTDFGLAKLLGSNRELTQTGQILGTLEYMPPEQASGRRANVSPATDVYALGAILYRLLTGRPPFQSESTAEAIRQILHDEPIEPRRMSPALHRDLETICLKCLEKKPESRFATAAELADELGRFLAGRPILSRHITRLERAWRWCRRNPLAVGLIASTILGTVSLVGMQYSSLAQAEAEKDRLSRLSHLSNARGLRRVLERRRDQWEMSGLLRQVRWSLANHSSPDPIPASTANGERHAAIEQLRQASRITSDSEIRSEAVYCLAFPDAEAIAGSADHHSPTPPSLRSLFLVANGKMVFATSHAGLVTWKTEGTEVNFESAVASSGTAVRTPIAVSADETWIARQSGQVIEICECDAAHGRVGRRIHEQPVDGTLRAVAFHSNNQSLAWSDDNKVAIWDFSKAKLREFREGSWSCLAFDPTGKLLAMATDGGSLEVRSIVSGELQGEAIQVDAKVRDLAWHLRGQELSFATSENVVRRWRINADSKPQVLVAGTGIFRSDESPDELQAIAYSPDGRYVAAGGTNGRVEIWDATNRQLVLTVAGDADPINDISWTRDKNGDTLFVAGEMRFRGWRITFPDGYYLLKGSDHGEWLPTLTFSPDSRLLATANAGIVVKVWDAEAGVLQHTLDVGSGERDVPWADSPNQRLTVHPSVAFSPDGKRLAIGGPHEVKLFETENGNELQSWKLERYSHQVFHFHPDGRLIAFQVEPSPEWQLKFAAGEQVPSDNRVAVLRDVATGAYASKPPTLPGSERIAPYYLVGVFYLSDGTRVVFDGNPPRPRGMPNQKYHQFDTVYRLPDGAKLDLPFADTDPARIFPAGPGWWHVLRLQADDTNRHELWHESNGRFTRKIELVGGPWSDPKTHYGIAVTPDGRMALTGTNDEAAPAFIVWDISTKQEVLRIPCVGSQPDFESMRLSPDGNKLAVSARDGTVYLLNFNQLERVLKSYGLGW